MFSINYHDLMREVNEWQQTDRCQRFGQWWWNKHADSLERTHWPQLFYNPNTQQAVALIYKEYGREP